MIKLFFLLMFLLVSDSAFADWVKVAEIHSRESPEIQIAYVDPATIQKNGNWVHMWVLVDHQSGLSMEMENRLGKFFSKSGNGITKSWKVKDEFDCKGEKLRMLSYVAYSEHMGNGETIPNEVFANHWEPVIPESIGQALWKFACGIK